MLLFYWCLILLQRRVLTLNSDVPAVPDCPVREYGGFLKRVCSNLKGLLGKQTLQCHNSKQRYTVGLVPTIFRYTITKINATCTNDTQLYQACISADLKIQNSFPPCGITTLSPLPSILVQSPSLLEKHLDWTLRSPPSGLLVSPLEFTVVNNLPYSFSYRSEDICNGVCDLPVNIGTVMLLIMAATNPCFDEMNCNDLMYGIISPGTLEIYPFTCKEFEYQMPLILADRILLDSVSPFEQIKPDHDVERFCELSVAEGFTFRLFNGSRCFPFRKASPSTYLGYGPVGKTSLPILV
eukprot:sb/3467470/